MKITSALLALASALLAPVQGGITGPQEMPFTDVRQYQFTRTNGADAAGDLSVPGLNTVTLTPCPLGIEGTATNHALHLDGGSGEPESPVISGGTCTSGAPKGTLRFVTAARHTGAWIVKSATAGLQEALAATSPHGTALYLPCGTWPVAATTFVERSNIRVQGAGPCTVLSSHAPGPVLHLRGATHLRVSDLALLATATAVESEAVRTTAVAKVEVANIAISGDFATGIRLSGGAFFANLDNIFVTGVRPGGIAIWVEDQSGVTIRNSFLYSQAPPNRALAGLRVTRTSGLIIESTDITLADYCLLLDPATADPGAQYGFFTNVLFDSCGVSGIYINPSGHGIVQSMNFANTWTSNNQIHGITITKTGGGSLVDGIQFVGHRSIFNQQSGLLIDGPVINIRYLSGTIAGNSMHTPNTYDGVSIVNGAAQVMIRDSRIGPSDNMLGQMRYGINVQETAGNHISILGNDISRNATGPLLFSATGLNMIVANNLGINDAVFPVIASDSSITIPVGPDNVTITGSTPIRTIKGGYIGRTINLTFTHARPAGIAAGGNVYINHRAIQHQTIQLIFDGQGWR